MKRAMMFYTDKQDLRFFAAIRQAAMIEEDEFLQLRPETIRERFGNGSTPEN